MTTIKELKDYCRKNKLKGYSKYKKTELEKLVNRHKAEKKSINQLKGNFIGKWKKNTGNITSVFGKGIITKNGHASLSYNEDFKKSIFYKEHVKFYKHKKINNLDFLLKYEKQNNISYDIKLINSAFKNLKHLKIYIPSYDFIAPVIFQGDKKTLVIAPILNEG